MNNWWEQPSNVRMPASAITLAAIAREKAAKRLEIKCLKLDSYLPEPGGTEVVISTPQSRPALRSLADCQDCIAELEQLEAGARDNYVCTHRPHATTPDSRREGQTLSVLSYKGHEEDTRQEILTLLKDIEEKLEILSDKTFEFTNIAEKPDAVAHDQHLNDWVKFVERLETRARSFLRALKDATLSNTVERGITPLIQNNVIPEGQQREQVDTAVNSGTDNTNQGGNNTEIGDVELAIAVESMNSLCSEIQADILVAEAEAEEDGGSLTSDHTVQLKSYCMDVQSKIDKNLMDAVDKVKRLDTKSITNVKAVFENTIPGFRISLRNLFARLRKSTPGINSVSPNTGSPTESVSGLDSRSQNSTNTGFKPYIEKLKLPTFSGKLEEWPEFRAIFVDMMENVPESAKLQYLRANIPAKDVSQIAGLTTLAEAWERLERTYGNVQLNIITVKGNLEKFHPSSNQDHKKVMEVFEAVERSVTQLTRLGSADHIKGDLSLIHKLVSKLPKITQGQYADHLSSPIVSMSAASDWDKFWQWFQGAYKSAIQTNLIQMSTEEKKSESLTCRICGRTGHFARQCPKKVTSTGVSGGVSGGASAKVNVAVTKISSRNEYTKSFQEAKTKVGSCPSCSGEIHMYKRKFSFGEADWPSRRLAACPGFQSKSARERGELVEALQACYVCTSTGHQANACFLKNKSNCTVITQGRACAASHHYLLHNTGVAYVKKIATSVVSSHLVHNPSEESVMGLPSLNQPVLLEIQLVHVNNGVWAKIMWDNGSTAALITHEFAERIHATGERISYWLDVVGHPQILRHTTLYTFNLVDNLGAVHTVQAYGIDRISDDSRALDLRQIKSLFPDAPSEVFNRPVGDIDILIGSMYKNLHPYGGEEEHTKGRLRLLRSIFGCGFVLSGTHGDIIAEEHTLCRSAKILVNAVPASTEDLDQANAVVMCNRSIVRPILPGFLEAEELGVRAPKSCKRCQGCKDCSFRAEMMSRDKEMVVRRLEDLIKYDAVSKKVSVSYPWTEDVTKLTDNIGQAISIQKSCERRLLKNPILMDAYNAELRKSMDRGVR